MTEVRSLEYRLVLLSISVLSLITVNIIVIIILLECL